MSKRISSLKELEKQEWSKVDKFAVFSAGILFLLCILSIIEHFKNG